MINPFELLKNMDNIKAQVEDLKNKSKTIRATGYAMGNMIEVAVTGELKVESIKIDPSMLKEENREMLEVLVASAVNNAFENIKARYAQEYGSLAAQYGVKI